MKVGAEPKKVALLAGLLVVLAYVTYTNVLRPGPAPAGTRATVARTSPLPSSARPEPEARPAPARPVLREFRPSLKVDRRERPLDPGSIDPTLRLDLLARLQSVTLTGGARNLFQFGPAPLPKNPEPKVIPKPKTDDAAREAPKPAETPKPPPPPIPLKFYGYASNPGAGPRRGFFLNGEDIIVAGEGEVIQKRYKVVRIGVNSAVVEDIEHKHQQTLALEEPS